MHILVVGIFPPEPFKITPGQFLQNTSENMQFAFNKLGHTVEIFDFRSIEKQKRSFFKWEYRLQKYLTFFQKSFFPQKWQTLIFRLPGIKKMNDMLLDKIKNNNYDLIFLAKAEKINYLHIDIFNQYSKTWYFFVDPLSIAKELQIEQYASKAIWASATRLNVVEFFKKAGANAVFLTQGGNPDISHPDEKVEKTYDVVFVGTIRKNRKKYIKFLENNGITVETFGEHAKHGHVFAKEMADIYRRSKIVLNLNTSEKSTGFSIRVFEALGTGSLFLSEYCKDLEMLFENKKELVWFSSPQECLELIEKYLKDPESRERIAQCGAERFMKEFTWSHVAQKICDIVNNS